MAALQIAKVNLDAGDKGAAAAQLRWVIDKSGHPELVQIARLRLAGVLLDEKSYDAALTQLSGEVPEALAASFADRRGDVLIAMGKSEKRAPPTRRRSTRRRAHPMRSIIQLKLDALPPPAAS